MQNTIKYKAFVLLTAVVAFAGCRKVFNLPDEKAYLSTQADYTTKEFTPIMGRTTILGGGNSFSPVGSTFPITFEIKNPHFGDGRDASDMLTVKPTLVWTQEYTGKETSLAAIEAKRHLENHPVLELRGNGDLVLYNNATANPLPKADQVYLRPMDSVVYPQNQRNFDVKITNSGGSRTIKNLILKPYVDQPYFPVDDYNTITGKPKTTLPGGKVLTYIYATVSGIRGETTNQFMVNTNNATTGIVVVYIKKFTDKPGDPIPNPAAVGHRLRFKFMNKDSVEINPAKFGDTKWVDQVHGFKADGTPGVELTPKFAEYNVAYPIPLAKIPTKFTDGGVNNLVGGDVAHVEFSYSRSGFGGVRETGKIIQNFKIFEKGDWEIVFHFKTVNPKFDND